MKTRIITALCTPLSPDGSLNLAALEAHIEDQWRHGVSGLLIAGSMGQMQLQSDQVYRDLVEHGVRLGRGRGELMVGVGDTSFARTRDRISLVQSFDIDGVVVLAPYFFKFSQPQLIEYFCALADASTKPVYLYDIAVTVGTKIELDTVLAVAKHPNIRGIKCSGAWEETRQLMAVVNDNFRVIPAQPHLTDQLIRLGVPENLDGVFGLIPRLTNELVSAAEAGDWNRAADKQRHLSGLLHAMRSSGNVFGCAESLLRARGIDCHITPAPFQSLPEEQAQQFLSLPIVQSLL